MKRGGTPLWVLILDAVLTVGGGAVGLATAGATETVGWTAFGIGLVVGIASTLYDAQGTLRKLIRDAHSG
jgi:hypothetical protein